MRHESISTYPNFIFLKIWSSPRAVFKFINDNKQGKYGLLLLMLSAMTSSFEKFIKQNNFGGFRFGNTMLIILGALVALILYYIFATVISWTGKKLDGKADNLSILRTMSYALIPSIIRGIFFTILIVFYGTTILKSNKDIIRSGLDANFYLFYAYEFLEGVLTIWTAVLFVIGISEVQKFSIIKSILNLALPAILIVIIFFLLFITLRIK